MYGIELLCTVSKHPMSECVNGVAECITLTHASNLLDMQMQSFRGWKASARAGIFHSYICALYEDELKLFN